MLRHIVMWRYKDGLTDSENHENAEKVKSILESLKDSIKEIIEIKVYINTITTSNIDIMLDSLFEDEESMAAYKIHPEHLKVVDFIGSVLQDRVVFDYHV